MKSLNKEQTEKGTKRDKTIFISIFCFAIAMIFIGIITAMVLGITNNDLDHLTEQNDEIISELEELEKL